MQQIYANLFKITKNTSSSFVNWFLFGLLYLVELSLVRQASTQNLEILLHNLLIVIYANLFKNASSPSFLDRFWFCLLYLIGLIGGLKICFKSHKLLLLLHFSTNFYCLFYLIGRAIGGFKTSTFYRIVIFFFFFFFFFLRSPGRDPGVQSAIIFFFFMSNLYFSLSNFFYFYVPSGASYFYFLTSRKLYHMKFAIFDVARCRMSATSLTFLLKTAPTLSLPFTNTRN